MGSPAKILESERAKYPAMQVDEILVWRRWLQLHQAEYDRFDYNVRIGTGVDPGQAFADKIDADLAAKGIQKPAVGPSLGERLRAGAIATRQLRLDAVGYQGPQPTIFEVKRRAGPQNVGQLLVYRTVWTAANPGGPAPNLHLVAADTMPHILGTVTEAGITLELVDQVDFSALSPGRLIPPSA